MLKSSSLQKKHSYFKYNNKYLNCKEVMLGLAFYRCRHFQDKKSTKN